MFTKIYEKIINYIKEEYVFLIILGLIVFIGLFKLPYNLHIGGGIMNIANHLEIEGEYKESGSYNMAYVKSSRATIPTYLLSYIFNWERESINESKIDENDNATDMWKREQLYLDEAINSAIISAYKEAGEEINFKKEKLQILYVDKDSQTDLEIGDEVVAIKGVKLNAFEDIQEIIKDNQVGDKIDVDYIRGDKEAKGYFIVREIDGVKKAGLYIIRSYDYEIKRKIDIDFSNKEGGPSGGFMLSLAIYDRLTEEDLTKGRKIAGTGTIDINGNIGEIGGVNYKIIGANSGDADVFFVPEANYEEAIKYKEEKGYDLNVVKVTTLSEAIDYLRRN